MKSKVKMTSMLSSICKTKAHNSKQNQKEMVKIIDKFPITVVSFEGSKRINLGILRNAN